MSFSTSAYLFFGVTVDLPEGVEWSTLDDDTADGIKMIHYGSDGDSMYAVAVADSVGKVQLDVPAITVAVDAKGAWPSMVRAFCKKHDLACAPPAWRLAVSRF